MVAQSSWHDDDLHGKHERHEVFARWICSELLTSQVHCVLDVAGGKGHLSAALMDRGVPCVLIDPFALRGRASCNDDRDMTVSAPAAVTPSRLVVLSNSLEEVLEHRPELLSECGAIVGLHPDEATEPIVDAALAHGVPFAVVPCCVFHKRLFSHRRSASGGGVRKTRAFLDYLAEKDPRMRRVELPFEGRASCLFMAANDYARPRQRPSRPNFTPCALAAKRGDLQLLERLRRDGHPWSEEVAQAAAWAGHVEVLRWAHAHGCPWSWPVVVQAATVGNQAQVLEWAQACSGTD